MIQRFVPSSAKRSSMQYQVFRNKNSSDEDFMLVNSIYKRIMSEDKALCDAAQKNLNAGIFVNGELHPRLEKGPLYFQKMVREAVSDHHKLESAAKRTIWPAQQTLPNSATVSKEDVDFCSGLACDSSPKELDW